MYYTIIIILLSYKGYLKSATAKKKLFVSGLYFNRLLNVLFHLHVLIVVQTLKCPDFTYELKIGYSVESSFFTTLTILYVA